MVDREPIPDQPQNPLEKFRGRSLDEVFQEGNPLRGKLASILIKRENALQQTGSTDGVIYELGSRYVNGESISSLARELGISDKPITRFFSRLGLPLRSQIEAVQATRRDPQMRQKNKEAISPMMRQRWQDPEYRREKSQASRESRMKPANQGKYAVPTIYGERWDIGFAQSSWEANLARVLRFAGRDYRSREALKLADGSMFELDFLTFDKRGRRVGYEIMANPLKGIEGVEKLERAIIDHPEIIFRKIDGRRYKRFRKMFAHKINSDPRFAGWEVQGDNLRATPDKYSV